MAMAVFAGALQPLQACINSRLASLLPARVQAAAVSLLVSMAIVTAMLVVQSLMGAAGDAPGLGALAARIVARVRPSAALGGACVAAVVCGGVFLPALMGTASYYVVYLAGELVGSLVLDAVGAFGLPVREPTSLRLLATALVLGAALAQQGGEAKPAASSGAAAAVAPESAATSSSAPAPAPTSPL